MNMQNHRTQPIIVDRVPVFTYGTNGVSTFVKPSQALVLLLLLHPSMALVFLSVSFVYSAVSTVH